MPETIKPGLLSDTTKSAAAAANTILNKKFSALQIDGTDGPNGYFTIIDF